VRTYHNTVVACVNHLLLTLCSAIYGKDALLFFSIAYSIPNILGLAVVTQFGKKVSLTALSVPSYIVMFLCLVAMPIMIVTGFAPIWPWGFITTLILIVICGFLTASVQGGVFGFAGVMPGKYMTAVMSGNGVAGLSLSILRMITKVAVERHNTTEEQRNSIIIFFSIASCVLIVCIVTYFIVVRLPIAKYYLARSGDAEKNSSTRDSDEDEIDNLINGHTEKVYGEFGDEEDTIILPKEIVASKKVNILVVFKKIWVHAFEVFYTFAVTLAIFPGLCTAIESQYKDSFLYTGHWLPVFMIFQFNLWDTIGRTAPMISQTVNRLVFKVIHIPLLARLIFLPLFCLCLRPPLPIFGNDFVALSLMLLLSFSNGYFSSLLMMFAPTKVEPHEGRVAGTMMTFFLVGGIVAGSNIGLLIGKLMGLN